MCICCSAHPHPAAGMWPLLLISVEWRGTCWTPPPFTLSPSTHSSFLLPGFGLQKKKKQEQFPACGLPSVEVPHLTSRCCFLTSLKWQSGHFSEGGVSWESKDTFDRWTDSSVAEADAKQSRSSVRAGGRRLRSGGSADYFQPWQ